jgi:hypothetical protein
MLENQGTLKSKVADQIRKAAESEENSKKLKQRAGGGEKPPS